MKERERTKAPTFLPVPHPAQEVVSQDRADALHMEGGPE